ncbi:MAG TPA: AbrB/MazE/SpoVT family DNA-binding domain-containing protein [Spirochaetia bacterium]|nr:AbrB/MazE/SpoVT family DNA-binding domain-containing protein [Spirochaetia bacterium]
MKTTVSEKGQITIPKALRDSLGIGAGTILEVEEREGGMILRKREVTDPIEQWRGKGRLPIGGTVDEYLDAIRG